ncbi:uncharacterized protein LACBIDRAFT_335216 [Laccaria bicolor S238N-H82]|uniref:Predicted protein n=1 Tax=Laccaria bicolor (strain S238N-H82 / ATCC MYA-4686) TaxID=486041 RepID=B0E1Q4_LACBS|nr:uncharacterized protein LACBIDRAFT_335216 [Laccaria bicolor S238N-H82]EDQ99235.1 predicted protein [Laccaria bicolor S238N-H82]|eukprot:XP_001890132.1 predicted protein [Laccaria bicolor S238N-H82]
MGEVVVMSHDGYSKSLNMFTFNVQHSTSTYLSIRSTTLPFASTIPGDNPTMPPTTNTTDNDHPRPPHHHDRPKIKEDCPRPPTNEDDHPQMKPPAQTTTKAPTDTGDHKPRDNNGTTMSTTQDDEAATRRIWGDDDTAQQRNDNVEASFVSLCQASFVEPKPARGYTTSVMQLPPKIVKRMEQQIVDGVDQIVERTI